MYDLTRTEQVQIVIVKSKDMVPSSQTIRRIGLNVYSVLCHDARGLVWSRPWSETFLRVESTRIGLFGWKPAGDHSPAKLGPSEYFGEESPKDNTGTWSMCVRGVLNPPSEPEFGFVGRMTTECHSGLADTISESEIPHRYRYPHSK